MSWLYLAIVAEIIATTALKASDGFSRLYPSVITVAGYGLAFYCLAIALKTIPVGIAYAIWSGVGIVAISLVGYILYKQTLDAAALLGIGLIVAGVIVLNVFSKTAAH
ncbi:MAG: multidrug efflux SMR transporter [Burkholderiaceae bacterium]